VRPENFQIESSICLQQDGRGFDLHGDYAFVGFSYSVTERAAKLS
jgi:hypothetical protein